MSKENVKHQSSVEKIFEELRDPIDEKVVRHKLFNAIFYLVINNNISINNKDNNNLNPYLDIIKKCYSLVLDKATLEDGKKFTDVMKTRLENMKKKYDKPNLQNLEVQRLNFIKQQDDILKKFENNFNKRNISVNPVRNDAQSSNTEVKTLQNNTDKFTSPSIIDHSHTENDLKKALKQEVESCKTLLKMSPGIMINRFKNYLKDFVKISRLLSQEENKEFLDEYISIFKVAVEIIIKHNKKNFEARLIKQIEDILPLNDQQSINPAIDKIKKIFVGYKKGYVVTTSDAAKGINKSKYVRATNSSNDTTGNQNDKSHVSVPQASQLTDNLGKSRSYKMKAPNTSKSDYSHQNESTRILSKSSSAQHTVKPNDSENYKIISDSAQNIQNNSSSLDSPLIAHKDFKQKFQLADDGQKAPDLVNDNVNKSDSHPFSKEQNPETAKDKFRNAVREFINDAHNMYAVSNKENLNKALNTIKKQYENISEEEPHLFPHVFTKHINGVLRDVCKNISEVKIQMTPKQRAANIYQTVAAAIGNVFGKSTNREKTKKAISELFVDEQPIAKQFINSMRAKVNKFSDSHKSTPVSTGKTPIQRQ